MTLQRRGSENPKGWASSAPSGRERSVAEVPKESGRERLAGVVTPTPDGNCGGRVSTSATVPRQSGRTQPSPRRGPEGAAGKEVLSGLGGRLPSPPGRGPWLPHGTASPPGRRGLITLLRPEAHWPYAFPRGRYAQLLNSVFPLSDDLGIQNLCETPEDDCILLYLMSGCRRSRQLGVGGGQGTRGWTSVWGWHAV